MIESETIAGRVTLTFADGVAEARLDRPDKLNALDSAMFEALALAGERLTRARGLRAVVLHGAGRTFSAGLDMASFAAMAAGGGETLTADLEARSHGIANLAQQAAFAWRALPVPVIAALHGVAFGGGFQIALGADVRYAAPDTKLAILEIKWGLVPDMGGIALMRELASGDVIRELAFTGRQFSGEEAFRYGFVTAVHADPLEAARRTARAIAEKSPDAVRALKRLLNASADLDAAALLLAESREQARIIGAPNQVEAVRAGLERRAPNFVDPE
nr:crotonase/enoyl-CoA hydratase family protein [Roseiarcus fermentans]